MFRNKGSREYVALICPSCHRTYNRRKKNPMPADCNHIFHSMPRRVQVKTGKETWIATCSACGGTKLILAPKTNPEDPAVMYCTECRHLYRLYEIEWRKL